MNVPLINMLPSKEPSAQGALTSSFAIGMPVATVIIWYCNTFVWPGQIPIEVAASAASTLSTIVGTLWHIVRQVLHRRGIDV